MKIGIVGLGFVGGTLEKWFGQLNSKWERLFMPAGYNIYRYDKFKNVGSIAEVNEADIIFVAVPTPFTDHYDDSAVRETLANIHDGKTVVIKSTVLPGSTQRFQDQYPNKTILFNPEFLTEANAYEDFVKPCRQIVGYANHNGKKQAPAILSLLPLSEYEEIMPSTEAELVKYMSNTFLSARVIFANQIYDICKAAGADYETVKNSVGMDRRIGHSHFDVLHGGYRGYGGHCLPKDTRALIEYGRSLGVSTDFLDSLERINRRLRTA